MSSYVNSDLICYKSLSFFESGSFSFSKWCIYIFIPTMVVLRSNSLLRIWSFYLLTLAFYRSLSDTWVCCVWRHRGAIFEVSLLTVSIEEITRVEITSK